ncbi:MAG: (2Fe-2S) ferredoxin domain-containing protein [Methanocalculus sp.]|uniref:(2Fe-2S) ferredoxin domain-containing protein n=1 Tax=Methanocalculus sp. TaxID=2004547 RepID=UPI00271B7E27|nr:(2Fe-2S) ferredoxin domain-containing protein [Methanocalculus sp.]MDO9539932.1 (2Fe-2S) ferredoxin domain-containing protein [Methanocalculus sp.]
MEKPVKHIFVCSSFRQNGMQKGFCNAQGSSEILMRFIDEIDDRELGGEVFISSTGCLGICEKGPIVVVYPDNVWYSSVTPDDVPLIVDSHIEGGTPVERLEI